MDASVAVTVRDEDVAFGAQGDVSGLIERAGRTGYGAVIIVPAAGIGGLAGAAQGEKGLAIGGEAADGVGKIVCTPDSIL